MDHIDGLILPTSPIGCLFISLELQNDHLQVNSLVRDRVVFDPFPLPKVPSTTLIWCESLCRMFNARHRVCLLIFLLLDRNTRRWEPFRPSQKCRRRAARWQINHTDFEPLRPSLLVAGSYQTQNGYILFEAHTVAPRFDGIHIVQQGRRNTFAFISRNGEAALADANAVMNDDLKQALDQASDRLRIQ
jgi:hypothetical protein